MEGAFFCGDRMGVNQGRVVLICTYRGYPLALPLASLYTTEPGCTTSGVLPPNRRGNASCTDRKGTACDAFMLLARQSRIPVGGPVLHQCPFCEAGGLRRSSSRGAGTQARAHACAHVQQHATTRPTVGGPALKNLLFRSRIGFFTKGVSPCPRYKFWRTVGFFTEHRFLRSSPCILEISRLKFLGTRFLHAGQVSKRKRPKTRNTPRQECYTR